MPTGMDDLLETPSPGVAFAVTNIAGGKAVLWIADGDRHRHFWCQYEASDVPGLPFRIRQARLGFEAGWVVSIIWGSATWSTNRDASLLGQSFTETPRTVELAVLDRDGVIVGDDPMGYVGPELALAVIDVVASMPTDHPTAADLIGSLLSGPAVARPRGWSVR